MRQIAEEHRYTPSPQPLEAVRELLCPELGADGTQAVSVKAERLWWE